LNAVDKWGPKRQRPKPNTTGFYQKPQLIDYNNNCAIIKKKNKDSSILYIANYQVTAKMRESLLSGNWLAEEVIFLLVFL
jgi:hypothetical protein